MKIKSFVASSIFVLVFLSFWQLDQKEKREFSLLVDKELEDIIQMDNELERLFQNRTEAFQPREYVRVKRVL